MTLFDYHFLLRWAYPVYGFSLILLSLVFVFGRSVAGQQNWIVLGGFSFQPSEFAKLALILALARYYSTQSLERTYSLKELIRPLGLLLPPLILVLLQKDLGGSIFFILLFVTITFFMKIHFRIFIFAAIFALIAGVGSYHFVLKGYQKDRVKTFLNPESDPRGKGYHLVQSKIAVGSGGWWGRGYLRGNINKLKYLPERHTDFIFPVLAEEWGFAGATFASLIMAIFLLLGLESASGTKDTFGALLALGVVGLFFWHVVINLGGVLGLMPLTGVPLPLLSYGGSSILTMMMGVGLLLNVRMRRFVF
jgi:rod shape determining protein RodA